MAKKKLTPKQAKFVREYMIDLNATRAAIRAGYSKKTAHSSGPRLLENVDVKLAISKLTVKQVDKAELTVEKVLANIEELRQAGYETGQLAASSSAVKMQAQYLAMLTDKQQIDVKEPIKLLINGK